MARTYCHSGVSGATERGTPLRKLPRLKQTWWGGGYGGSEWPGLVLPTR
jgi:hypothetical protein